MSYWTNRQEQLKKTAEKDEAAIKKRLSKFYDAEFKRLDKEIAAYYQKYGEDSVIEYRQLMESLSDEDKRLLMQQMDEFATKYPQYADLMPVRESIYRLDRLQGLQYSIYMAQANIAGYTNEQIREYETSLAQKGLNYAMETLGFGKNFYGINSDIVKQFVDVAWSNGENFSTRIWNDTQKLAQYLNQDMAQGLARGDRYDRLVRNLKKRFDRVNRNNAYRLVFTEGTYVMAESTMQPFKEDFEQYRLSPVLDSRTCPICRGLRERVFLISERQPGVNFPPIHPWCRCTWEIVVDDWDAWMDNYKKTHTEKQAKAIENRLRGSSDDGIININNLKSIDEVELQMKKQRWFNVQTIDGKQYDTNETLSLKGIDVAAAKSIYKTHEQLFERFPQLRGKLNSVTSAQLDRSTYAQCSYGFGHGGISVNKRFFSDFDDLQKQYAHDVEVGWHPRGTDANAIVMHELGHAIDDYLTYIERKAGHNKNGSPRAVSNELRAKVMRACGLRVSDIRGEVSEYAAENPKEWFAECFAEWMCSSAPRKVAKEFGKQIERILKEVK